MSKYLFGAVVTICATMIFVVGTWIGRLENDIQIDSQVSVVETNDDSEEIKKEYHNFRTREYYTLSADHLVYGEINNYEGPWKMTMWITGTDRRSAIFSRKIEGSKNIDELEMMAGNFMADWSRNSRNLVVAWDGKGWQWDTTDWANIRYVKELVLPEAEPYERVFLGKLSNEVYFVSNKGVHTPDGQVVRVNGTSLVPLDNQEGFSYWLYPEENTYYQDKLVVCRDNKQTIYETKKKMDVAGEQILSPDMTKVCNGFGSSGYWGYSIWDLDTAKEYLSGPQYSYCVKWLDNNRVLLKEVPYHYQWTTQYYIYDIITGKKDFIFADKPKNENI